MSRIIQVVSTIFLVGTVMACAPKTAPDPRLSGPSVDDLNRMASAPGAPTIISRSPGDIAAATNLAARYLGGRLPEARGLRFLEISAIPYLRRSPEGAAFLNLKSPRALARGAPAEICPAAATSSAGAETAIGAMEDALNQCLGQLSARGANTSCGCRVMAVDNALVASRRDFVFAPGVSAFMIRSGTGEAERLIAESEPAPNGGESVVLRNASGAVAVLGLKGGDAELRLRSAPTVIWRGPREFFGYRRGRLSERMVLTSDDGKIIRLLIGVENRDAVAAK